jgi:hypothetical protein
VSALCTSASEASRKGCGAAARTHGHRAPRRRLRRRLLSTTANTRRSRNALGWGRSASVAVTPAWLGDPWVLGRGFTLPRVCRAEIELQLVEQRSPVWTKPLSVFN